MAKLKEPHEGIQGVLFPKQEVFVVLTKVDVSFVVKVAAERKSKQRGGKAPHFPAVVVVVVFFGFH